ncbi:MAG: hypothetical protein ACREIQ_02175 [Nitrospiria bacterium]
MSQFNPDINDQGVPLGLEKILMPSSSLSASTAISITNFAGKGAYFFMNVTSAFPGSGSTTVALKVKMIPPNATASAVTLAAMVPRSASGMNVLCIYPGALRSSTAPSASTDAIMAVFGSPLPRTFNVVASMSTGATSKEIVLSLGMTAIY